MDQDRFRREFETSDFFLFLLSGTGRRVSSICAETYLSEFGLLVPEWRVLAQIGRFGSITPSEISDKTSMDRVTVSRAVTSCVARGLVAERVGAKDRRSKSLSFTAKGRALYASFLPAACALSHDIESGLSDAERRTFKRLLTKLNAHLDQRDARRPEEAA